MNLLARSKVKDASVAYMQHQQDWLSHQQMWNKQRISSEKKRLAQVKKEEGPKIRELKMNENGEGELSFDDSDDDAFDPSNEARKKKLFA